MHVSLSPPRPPPQKKGQTFQLLQLEDDSFHVTIIEKQVLTEVETKKSRKGTQFL